MSRKILGLDIREEGVSAVLIKTGFKGIGIEAHAYLPFEPPGDGIVPALEALSRDMDLNGAACAVSLPANRMSFRNLSLPFKDIKKIRQILPFELEPSLPLPLEAMAFDFDSVESAEKKNHTDLFVALVEKARLDAYLTTLAEHKIRPETIAVAGYASAQVLAQQTGFPPDGMVIDVENKRCTLVVVSNRTIRLVRSVPVGHNGRAACLRLQIERTLQAFSAVTGITYQPDALLMTGPGLGDGKIEDQLTQLLEIPVQRADIMRDTNLRIKRQAMLDWDSAHLDGALSLALMEAGGGYGINFREGSLAFGKLFEEHRGSLVRMGIGAGLVLIFALFTTFYDSVRLRREVADLDREVSRVFKETFPEITRIVDPVQQMRLKLETAKQAMLHDGEGRKPVRTIDLLNEISKLIPETTDVELTRLVIGAESLLIDGNTDTFNAVDDIKNRLEGANLFKEVTISSANIDRSENRVRFKLKGGF